MLARVSEGPAESLAIARQAAASQREGGGAFRGPEPVPDARTQETSQRSRSYPLGNRVPRGLNTALSLPGKFAPLRTSVLGTMEGRLKGATEDTLPMSYRKARLPTPFAAAHMAEASAGAQRGRTSV